MNTATGEIIPWIGMKDLIEKNDPSVKFCKEIPDEVLPLLQGMNRKQRREFYRKNKKLFKPVTP
jgi:hypothetical protein